MRFSKILFFILIVLHIYSCKKIDEIPPIIKIQSPQQSAQINGESINVIADVSDNENIETVTVALYELGKYSSPKVTTTFFVNEKSYQVDFQMNFEQVGLTGGQYVLEIQADDGNQFGYASVEIRLNIMAVQLKGIVVVEEDNNQSTIHQLSLNGLSNPLNNLAYKVSGVAIDSRNQDYIIAQKDNQIITSRSLIDNFQNWQLVNANQGGPYQYKSLKQIELLNYLMKYENQIEIIRVDGLRSGLINTFYRPQYLLKSKNKLYVIEKDDLSNYYLSLYHVNGAKITSINLPINAVEVVEKDDGNLYILGNKNGQGNIMQLNVDNLVLNPIKTFSFEIRSAIWVDHKLLFNGNDDVLYEYSLNLSAGISRINNIKAEELKLEPLENFVYYRTAPNGEIGRFDPISFSKQTLHNYPNRVVDFEFLYTK